MRSVTVIPPTTIRPIAHTAIKRKRVAAYARVSTDTDEQFTSFEAQVDYYTQKIKANHNWLFLGVYSDEGVSATSMKNRDGFNRMIDDALAGKIDLILTKSVSRFARNTVDTLTTVRKLKDNGVEVYFEKDYIKHGTNPVISRVYAVFDFRFVACLSLKYAKRYLKISRDTRIKRHSCACCNPRKAFDSLRQSFCCPFSISANSPYLPPYLLLPRA